QQDEDPPIAQRDALEPAECRCEALQPRNRVFQLRAQGECQRGGSERVVDVVKARNTQADAALAGAGGQREVDAVQAVHLYVTRGDVERRPAMTAGRAPVVAQVTDVGGGVLVGPAAGETPLRVGRVLEGRNSVTGVVEPEND